MQVDAVVDIDDLLVRVEHSSGIGPDLRMELQKALGELHDARHRAAQMYHFARVLKEERRHKPAQVNQIMKACVRITGEEEPEWPED